MFSLGRAREKPRLLLMKKLPVELYCSLQLGSELIVGGVSSNVLPQVILPQEFRETFRMGTCVGSKRFHAEGMRWNRVTITFLFLRPYHLISWSYLLILCIYPHTPDHSMDYY